jgi:hypothetical protein
MADENLEKKILEWLNTQGFGVEMRVAKVLNAASFNVLKSSYYEDPETGTSREIDVIARMTDDFGLLEVYSIIECKKSSRPWVVFTSEQAMANRLSSFAIMSNTARDAMWNHILQLRDLDWFMKPGRLGYGIAQALFANADETFKAGLTATKASISYLMGNEKHPSFEAMSFYFPTVVLDGHLFEAYLGEDNNPVIAEVDSSFLIFPIMVGKYRGSSVRIVTLQAFKRYCDDLKSVYDFLKKEFSEEEIALAESIDISREEMEIQNKKYYEK